MTKILLLALTLFASCAAPKVVYQSPKEECFRVHCPAAAREEQQRLLSVTYDEIDDDCVCELGTPGNLYVTKRK